MRSFILLALAAVLLRAAPAEFVPPVTRPLTEPAAVWSYRGFLLDASRLGKSGDVAALRKALEEQVDIVWAAGLPETIMTFFQQISLQVVPATAGTEAQVGRYTGKHGDIEIGATVVNFAHRPVLLHELLHAFHDQRLPDGYKNADVAMYFERAQVKEVYAAKSHMMENVYEFFACSATTYLNGVSGQEPYLRERIKENQPRFYDFLATLFEPNAGHYPGSLSAAPPSIAAK